MRITMPTLAALCVLALAGCAVGPNYRAPTLSDKAAAPFLGAHVPVVSVAQPAPDWWQLYNDPVLNGLVADALSANTDIRAATARLERERALLHGARGEELPQTTIDASDVYERLPEIDTLPGEPRQTRLIDGGLSVGYELDLFGHVRRSVEAAKGDVAVAAADADAVRVAVIADTTRAYVDAASSAERLAVAQQTVALLDNSLRVTARRQSVGFGSRLDVVRLAALRDQRAALVPGIEAERQAALFRLAMLTGRTPQELPAIAGARTTTPQMAQAIPVGDGAALLARRPDVRAAERQLAADTARIGIATADLYPRITFGGSIGQTSTGFNDIFAGGPYRFMFGPQISWNFPNQIAARASIAAAKSDASGSLARFDGTVLRALDETETALANYSHALDGRVSLTAARDQAATAMRIIRARQHEGQVDALDVLDAERTYADTEADLAAADARIADDQVDLFRALGGGWQRSQVATVVQTARQS